MKKKDDEREIKKISRRVMLDRRLNEAIKMIYKIAFELLKENEQLRDENYSLQQSTKFDRAQKRP